MRRDELPRIVNLKQGPLDVTFTGEPFWTPIHFLPHDGRRGATMPCLSVAGDGCPVHVGRPRWCVLSAGAIRRRREQRHSIEREEAQREKIANFRKLPEEVRQQLLGQARNLRPADGVKPPMSFLEQWAADIMWPPKPEAQAVVAEWESVVVDLPTGAAQEVCRRLEDQPWAGNRVLITRPHVAADADVRVLERGIADRPEAFSIPERMGQHWGFNVDCARLRINDRGRTELHFTMPGAPAKPIVAKAAEVT